MPCPGRPCRGAGPDFDTEVAPRGTRLRPPLGHALQDRLGHRGGAQNGRPAGSEYPGFFAAYVLERRAEPIGVVQPDRADHGHICIDDVGRIEAPAQPHLDHGKIHCRATEDVIGSQRAVFEESQRDFAARGLDALEGFEQQPIIDRLAVERDPLRVPHEVGRGVGADAQARLARDGSQECDRGALAVRPPDQHHRHRSGQETQAQRDLGYSLEAEVYGPGMLRLLVGQPLLKRPHAPPARGASSAGAAHARADPACPADRRSCRSPRAPAGTRCAGNPPEGFHARSAG